MRFDKVLRLGVVGFGIIVFVLIIFVNQSYAKRIFKLGHIDPDDPFVALDQAAVVVFKNMVMIGTNGEIEVQIFLSSVLGKERESMEMVKNGLL